MRTINIFHGLAIVCLATSCSDYLKEDSGDLLIPEKVEEYQSVLFGEGYPKDFADDVAFIDLMTDDVAVIDGSPYNDGGYDNINIPVGRGAYCWAYDVEYYAYDCGDAYENRYSNILACNTIIEHEDDMTGSDSDRNYCVAQAYAMRAYNYFCLVNWYGLPYSKQTAASDMGVAITLKSQVTREHFTRSTVQQVYDQINADLDRALELFDETSAKASKYLFSKNAALLLKSRVALFTEDWDDVIKYGEELYNAGLALQDLSGKTASDLGDNYYFINEDNPEIIFNFGGDGSYYHKYLNTYLSDMPGPVFATSQDGDDSLIQQYEAGDNRLYAFFMQDEPLSELDGQYPEHTMSQHFFMPKKFNSLHSGCYKQAFRSAECLLNLAEAYIQKGGSENTEKALSMLNELRKARFTAETYKAKTADDFTSADDLLAFTRTERRRELCFEESHRWMDLRREGCPRLVHKFRSSDTASEETYILEQGDRNYTLALPYSESNYNTAIEKYERRVITAQ